MHWKVGSEGAGKMREDLWKGVPIDKIQEWQELFNVISINFEVPGRCPVCGEHALRHYYYLDHQQRQNFNRVEYQGRGSVWEWCSKCRTYSHAQALVPKNWVTILPEINHFMLTPIPNLLDDAISAVVGPIK
jgi:hypothetical protein